MSTTLTPIVSVPDLAWPIELPDTRPVAVFATVAAVRSALDDARRAGLTVGLVPTMGALHAGHRSLIERAARECDVVVVSIFVNPTQFGDPADLAAYPRTLDADVAVVADGGGHLVFAPTVAEMYPNGAGSVLTTVAVPALAARWEGASRPGHFDGVATVVTKLLAIAGPCRAYFGEKDFQQLAVVNRAVADLSLPVVVVGCHTVREADGLALSSRNVRLSADGRRAALVLSRALRAGAAAVSAGMTDPSAVESVMAAVVADEPSVDLDYAVLVNADDLDRPGAGGPVARPLRLLVAATVDGVRLIDNVDPYSAD
jgi:pantoate--beta-alanine ligase